MERKFSKQLKSFQELLLREAQVIKGINLQVPSRFLCHSLKNRFSSCLIF